MRILVDTNILVRLAQTGHPPQRRAAAALTKLRAAGDEPSLVPQVLYEYWVVCTRPREQNGLGLTVAQVCADLARMKRLFALLRDERAILPHWERIVSDHEVMGKAAHDARLVAAMHRHSLSHILTLNPADFRRFPGITVLTPDDVLDSQAEKAE